MVVFVGIWSARAMDSKVQGCDYSEGHLHTCVRDGARIPERQAQDASSVDFLRPSRDRSPEHQTPLRGSSPAS